jgi:integrase
MAKKVLSPSFVRGAAKPKSGRGEAVYMDGACKGFALRVSPTGGRSYLFLWQEPRGGGGYDKRRLTLAAVTSTLFDGTDSKPIAGAFVNGEEIANVRARIAVPMRARVEQGLHPLPNADAPNAKKPIEKFEAVAARFLELHSTKNRSHRETKRILDTYVLPEWCSLPMTAIKRSTVTALLDKIQARKAIHPTTGRPLGGAVQVDRVLAQIRTLMNWHAARDDEFISPIVKGMARTKPRERARTRVLSDDEIRALWRVTPTFGLFGSLARALLLTAQRRTEVVTMRRGAIDAERVWEIEPADNKTKVPKFVPLSKPALTEITEVAKVRDASSDFVFTTNGDTPWNGFGGPLKSQLDQAMLADLRKVAADRGQDPSKVELKPWVLHDLRRTAKTLMSRAGVAPHISERVLGHVIDGVEGVYDRHHYLDEKRDALERLASLVAKIVAPSTTNLAPIHNAVAAE